MKGNCKELVALELFSRTVISSRSENARNVQFTGRMKTVKVKFEYLSYETAQFRVNVMKDSI